MLQISHLQKYYDNRQDQTLEVFRDFNLDVAAGELVALFGPNGCGKTTLLNIVAGVLEPAGGHVLFKNKPVNTLKVGYVFQDYRNSLFPWLKVKDNIAFPLKLKKCNASEPEEKVRQLCERFNVALDLEAYPYQLSGGQQQLISLLRGLIIEPEIYLLDEPFSSLDYQTNLLLLERFAAIWEKTNITTLLVSHEIDEAIFLAQRIIVFSNKPTRVLKIFTNPLPYPRKLELFSRSEFAMLKAEILNLYCQEIKMTNASSNIGSSN